jgi:hypothetical protein
MDRMSSAPALPALAATADSARQAATHRVWGFGAALLATLALPFGLYLAMQRSGYEELLGLSRLHLAGEEPWLLPAVIISTSMSLLLPALLLSAGLQLWGRPKLAGRCYVALGSLALFSLLVDLDLQRSIGRHAAEVLHVALQPQGHVAAGHGLGGWAMTLAQWALLALAGSTAVAFVCRELGAALAARLTPLLQRTLGTAGCLCLAALVIGPQLLRNGWRNLGLLERTYGTLLLDLRLGGSEPDDTQLPDPVLRSLYPRLRETYRTAFPTLLAGRAADPSPVPLPEQPPNVILIITESLRQDAFAEELMPRLSHWAEGGMVAAAHGPGTIYSQAATFALLYGRSPAVYHQTLDAHVPPQFCVTLRASGYECDYFSGHPKVWLRREDYLNAQTMDHFVHDDRGTWPEWDRRALDNMLSTVASSSKPVFAIVLLMSSHFEYQYPPEYEIDRPVANSSWMVTNTTTLGPDAQIPHRNRYRNCVRFIDDMVADAIGKLDPKRNLVIFTGDHGESLYDDGHYSHGYAFSEIVTKTPFAMVGPGVSPSRIAYTTEHVDVFPTVLHVLSGQHQSVAHLHGNDWLQGEVRNSFLESYSPDGRDRIKAQLRSDGLFLRLDLDVKAPRLTLLGFEDAFGSLLPSPQISALTADHLVAAFDEQLGLLRR